MVRRESRSSTISHITLGTKQTGAPSAGNLHAGCDVAGAGNGFTVWLLRHSQRKRGATARLDLRNTAPVLDPTGITVAILANSTIGHDETDSAVRRYVPRRSATSRPAAVRLSPHCEERKDAAACRVRRIFCASTGNFRIADDPGVAPSTITNAVLITNRQCSG